MAPQLRGSVTPPGGPAGPAAGQATGDTTARAASDTSDWVARTQGLSRVFGGRRVLDDLDLDIAPGEFVALIGRSGSGKSTLLRALAGLDPEVRGTAEVRGAAAVAFQEPRLVPWKRVTANVCLGLRSPDPRRAAAAALAEVGLDGRADAWPLTLSGGEAQRVSLARALVREPRLLLLDEPFSALDALTTITMHQLVLRLWRQHQPAVLLVTHDVDEALALADRVLVLTDGRIGYSCRIDAARPRDRDDPDLITARAALLAELGVAMEGIR
jgi:sulfonate transport system ATP-binding protein